MDQPMKDKIAQRRQKALEIRQKKSQIKANVVANVVADVVINVGASSSVPNEREDEEFTNTREGKRRRTVSSTWQTDTNAGFFLDEEEEKEEEEEIQKKTVYEQAPESAPQYPRQTRCVDCNAEFFNSYLEKHFGVFVCDACRDRFYDEKYSLVTKQTAKDDYLLKDSDLAGRSNSLKFVERKNRKNVHWSSYKLYLLSQVEERSFQHYGGEDGLNAEFEARDLTRRTKAIAAQKKAVKKLRKATLTSAWLEKAAASEHVHDFAAEEYNKAEDLWSKKCKTCDYAKTYEKM
eukprot:m.195569 g.195569  ORF g.195569 m.195569 type:complete len:291 (+) comp32574_c1_seq2:183-1055(+)